MYKFTQDIPLKNICHANSACREHAQDRPEIVILGTQFVSIVERGHIICNLWLDDKEMT